MIKAFSRQSESRSKSPIRSFFRKNERDLSPVNVKAPKTLWQPDVDKKSIGRVDDRKPIISIHKPKNIKGKCSYVELAASMRIVISDLIYERKGIFNLHKIFRSQIGMRGMLEIFASQLRQQNISGWEFSSHEIDLLILNLKQLIKFIEFIGIKGFKYLSDCLTIQNLLTRYMAYYTLWNHTELTCDLGFLFYLCNFQTSMEDLGRSKSVLFDLIDSPKEEFIFLRNYEYVEIPEIVLYGFEKNEISEIMTTRSNFVVFKNAGEIKFSEFNSHQRSRYMFRGKHYALIKDLDRKEEITDPITSSLLEYYICPDLRDDKASIFDRIKSLLKNLSIQSPPRKPAIYCSILSNENLTPLLHLPQDSRLSEIVELLFGDKNLANYSFLESQHIIESFYNFQSLNIIPLASKNFHPSYFSDFENMSIIPIDLLYSRDRDLCIKVLSEKANFGTDLWLVFDPKTSQEKNLLINIGLFTIYAEKNGLDKNDWDTLNDDAIKLYKVWLDEILGIIKSAPHQARQNFDKKLETLYIDETRNLIFCNQCLNLNLENSVLLTKFKLAK